MDARLVADTTRARTAEVRARGDRSRSLRRPDEVGAWISDLFQTLTDVDDACRGRGTRDPRRCLVEVIATASVWAESMGDT